MSSWSILIVILFVIGSECKKKTVSEDHRIRLNVCTMKIDGGDCVGESFSNEDFDNSTVHYAFNNETKKCQEFKFEGCGGNENRFDSRQECWRMCYTPLKYFLTRVTEYLIYRYKDPLNKTNTTLHNSKQKN